MTKGMGRRRPVDATARESAELDDIYDPSTDVWVDVPLMSVGHCHHTMTGLYSGLALVAGGRWGPSESIAVTELYDQVGKKWSPSGSLDDARGFHVATQLMDGTVLVAGGILVGGSIAAPTEIYTPA